MVIIRIIKKFKRILSNHQKFRIFELLIMMIIGGFMEMLSVSMMIPLMQAIVSPEKIMEAGYVQWIIKILGIESYQKFLVFISLLVAFLYIVKNIYLIFQMTIQTKFVNNNQFYFQCELLRSFLSRPYEFFLSAKSGEIVRMVYNDTLYAFAALTTLLSLASEIVVSVILCGTILVLFPQVTCIIMLMLLVVIGLIYLIIKKPTHIAGERVQESAGGMYQILLQTVQGIKEVKLMKKEPFFQRRYEYYGNIYVRNVYINQVFSLIPRFMIEAFIMGLFFVMLAVMINNGAKIEEILPMLGTVAMAAVRLLPCANRITNALADLTYREPAVDKILENIDYLREIERSTYEKSNKIIKKNAERIDALNDKVEVRGITYKYPQGEKLILDNANFVIEKGQSVGIVGASGSGKTTAVDLLLGLLEANSGDIIIDGIDIRQDMDGWLSQIGYIPQSIFLYDGSIRENVAFGIDDDKINEEQVWNALKEASLYNYVKGLPDGLDTQIGERGIRLSGGQRQRIGIARALYINPEILFFDEATSALDNETESAIMESVDQMHGSKTMIIIAHRLTTIQNCDVVYRVENGKIIRER